MIKYYKGPVAALLYRINKGQLEVLTRMKVKGKKRWIPSLYADWENSLRNQGKLCVISDEEAALWTLEHD